MSSIDPATPAQATPTPAPAAHPPTADPSKPREVTPPNTPPPADAATVGTPPVPPAAPAPAKDAKPAPGGLAAPVEPAVTPAADASQPAPVYEFKLPEGFVIPEAELAHAKTLFAEMKLDPVAAQKLVDLEVSRAKTRAEAADAAFKQAIEHDRQTLMKDPEFGGAQFAANEAKAARAFRAVFGDEAVQLLADVGLHYDPRLLKGALKLSTMLSEARMVGGGKASAADERTQQLRAMYPDMVPKD